MTYLLHAIARAGDAEAPPGLRGAPLEFIAAGPLGAWATRDPVESGTTREDAFEHHRVVEDLCAAQPCLPVRLGTRLPDAEAVRALISARVEELLLTLERVGSRRELAVTLLWPDSGIEPGRGHTIQARTPGRAFLERKQSDQAADDARLATAERLARALETGLATERSDVRHAMCPSSRVALSTAVLARPGEADALKERAVEIVSRLDGVRGVVSGPWPPYTFAGTS